jgi:hypothetical protein
MKEIPRPKSLTEVGFNQTFGATFKIKMKTFFPTIFNPKRRASTPAISGTIFIVPIIDQNFELSRNFRRGEEWITGIQVQSPARGRIGIRITQDNNRNDLFRWFRGTCFGCRRLFSK